MDSQPQEPVRVARRVYVGNLPFRTSWQDLKDHFSVVGRVKYADILREGGPGSRSKGCGIVEFETPEEAIAAILQLSHSELDGRQIFVREDREDYELKERPPPPRRVSGFPRTRVLTGGVPEVKGQVSIGRRVYVGNVGYETTGQQLKDHFRQAGHVVRANVLSDDEGRSKGCGLVEFESPAEALRSISLLSNSILNRRQIMVREDRADAVVAGGGGQCGTGGGCLEDCADEPISGDPGAEGAAGYTTGEESLEGTRLLVYGLPDSMPCQHFHDLCLGRGCRAEQVVSTEVPTNDDGSTKGVGLIHFASPEAAKAASLLLHGRELEGRMLTVYYHTAGIMPAGGGV